MQLEEHKPEFEKVIHHLKRELVLIHTGRANPALVENIQIEVYGTKMPLIQLASISVPQANQILVEPWDKNITKEIERGLQKTNLGFSVINKGSLLRLNLPSLTEETRKNILKVLHNKLEQARISLRGLRDKIRERIIEAQKEKEISEDERYRLQEGLDKMTREYTEKIDEMGEKKEEEIII